jgi:drug/metabolite transporter (DMT)-like permease
MATRRLAKKHLHSDFLDVTSSSSSNPACASGLLEEAGKGRLDGALGYGSIASTSTEPPPNSDNSSEIPPAVSQARIWMLQRVHQDWVINERAFELWFWGVIIGVVTYAALTLQQLSLTYIEATKAAFITSLYVIFTPIVEHFLLLSSNRQRPPLHWTAWAAAGMSAAGAYLLTGCAESAHFWSAFGLGEAIVFASMLLLTIDIIMADRAAKRVDCVDLTCIQFAIVAVISCIAAPVFEPAFWWQWPPLQELAGLRGGWDMIMLVAFTEGFGMLLSMVGQMHVPSSRAALIYGFEGITTAVFAYSFLGERLSWIETLGCALVVAATFLTATEEEEEGLLGDSERPSPHHHHSEDQYLNQDTKACDERGAGESSKLLA